MKYRTRYEMQVNMIAYVAIVRNLVICSDNYVAIVK